MRLGVARVFLILVRGSSQLGVMSPLQEAVVVFDDHLRFGGDRSAPNLSAYFGSTILEHHSGVPDRFRQIHKGRSCA